MDYAENRSIGRNARRQNQDHRRRKAWSLRECANASLQVTNYASHGWFPPSFTSIYIPPSKSMELWDYTFGTTKFPDLVELAMMQSGTNRPGTWGRNHGFAGALLPSVDAKTPET
jgi:hypothetical protein